MTKNEFQKSVRTEFSFLLEHGFTESVLTPDSIYVTYRKENYAIELKLEDYGTLIIAYLIRKGSPEGFVNVGDIIEKIIPAEAIPFPCNYSADFNQEKAIQYYAGCLKKILPEFWDNKDALWLELIGKS